MYSLPCAILHALSSKPAPPPRCPTRITINKIHQPDKTISSQKSRQFRVAVASVAVGSACISSVHMCRDRSIQPHCHPKLSRTEFDSRGWLGSFLLFFLLFLSSPLHHKCFTCFVHHSFEVHHRLAQKHHYETENGPGHDLSHQNPHQMKRSPTHGPATIVKALPHTA